MFSLQLSRFLGAETSLIVFQSDDLLIEEAKPNSRKIDESSARTLARQQDSNILITSRILTVECCFEGSMMTRCLQMKLHENRSCTVHSLGIFVNRVREMIY